MSHYLYHQPMIFHSPFDHVSDYLPIQQLRVFDSGRARAGGELPGRRTGHVVQAERLPYVASR